MSLFLSIIGGVGGGGSIHGETFHNREYCDRQEKNQRCTPGACDVDNRRPRFGLRWRILGGVGETSGRAHSGVLATGKAGIERFKDEPAMLGEGAIRRKGGSEAGVTGQPLALCGADLIQIDDAR
jgi:hypothetical protein